jgi:hypothetical protein
MHLIKRILIIIICTCIIVACDYNEKKTREKLFTSIVENNIGKKIILPDNLTVYNPDSINNCENYDLISSEFKIYSHIDVSCGSCIGNIEKWNNLIQEFSKYEVPLILICGSEDEFELFQYLCESGKVDISHYPFYFDVNNDFHNLNTFMIKSDFETVLADKENNILLIGNPIRSKEMKELYLNVIKEKNVIN